MKVDGQTMNKVYDLLKDLTDKQIERVKALAWSLPTMDMAELLIHQCDFVLARRAGKVWDIVDGGKEKRIISTVGE
jgi:hypothetical protein